MYESIYVLIFASLLRIISIISFIIGRITWTGDYELINRTTGVPNPDYYVALLWHDHMGKDVMNLTMDSLCSDPASACAHELRVHAHTAVNIDGGITVVLINFSEQSGAYLLVRHGNTNSDVYACGLNNCAAYSVNLGDEYQSGTMWQLRGQPHSNQIFLNDKPLVYPAHSDTSYEKYLPELVGKEVAAVELPPVSVTFVEYESR